VVAYLSNLEPTYHKAPTLLLPRLLQATRALVSSESLTVSIPVHVRHSTLLQQVVIHQQLSRQLTAALGEDDVCGISHHVRLAAHVLHKVDPKLINGRRCDCWVQEQQRQS